MNWLFVAVQVAAFARLVWVRFPCRCWTVALGFAAAQAINVNLAQPTEEWSRTWWMYPEAVLVALTAGACIEAIERSLRAIADPLRALLLRVASIGIPACIVGALAYFVAPPAGDSLAVFVQVRAWIWAYLSLAMIVVELLLVMDAPTKRPRWVVAHSLLLLTVIAAHVPLSRMAGLPESDWHALRANLYRPLVMLCCVGWLIAFRGRGEALRLRGEAN
jgi:hypothetical protein